MIQDEQVLRTVLREFGFRLDRTGSGLRRRRGLLTRTDVTDGLCCATAVTGVEWLNGNKTLRLSFPSQATPGTYDVALVSYPKEGGEAGPDLLFVTSTDNNELRVLSLPIIIAQNNKQAVLNVGTRRPFIQVSQSVTNDPLGRIEAMEQRRRLQQRPQPPAPVDLA